MEPISPTSISSSSADSFHTAVVSPSNGEESTTASSTAFHRPSPYRSARDLPRELKEHCKIYLEEELCKSTTASLHAVLER
jgi:hypothetical protein